MVTMRMIADQQRHRPETGVNPVLAKENSNQQSTRGFTLIELLVVILIVITLGAISFMVITSTKSSAHTSLALANLRQISVASHAVARESYDILSSTTWKNESSGTTETYWWTPLMNYMHPDTNGKINGLFQDPASPAGSRFSSSEFRNAEWAEISYIPWAYGSTDWRSQVRGIERSSLKVVARQPHLSTVVMGTAIPAVMRSGFQNPGAAAIQTQLSHETKYTDYDCWRPLRPLRRQQPCATHRTLEP